MKQYSLSSFNKVPRHGAQLTEKLSMTDLPGMEEVKTLARWSTELVELFNQDPTQKYIDRSAEMSRFAYLCAEMDWTDEQMMVGLEDLDDRWGKYKGRKDKESRLVSLIERARLKYGYNLEDFNLEKMLGKPPGPPADSTVEIQDSLVYQYGDFLDSDFPINWMLEDLLSEGGLGFITGFPGTGKTTLCLQIAHQLALGSDKFLKWDNVSSAKKVLFISLEMGKHPLHLFLSKIAQSYDDRRTLQKNFMIAPFGEPMPLDSKAGQAFFTDLVKENMPDVVIIDSLQTILSADMKEEAPVKSLFHFMSYIRKEYGTTMLLVHHNRKKSSDNQKKDTELSDMYGSTYIAAYSDFVLNLTTMDSSTLQVKLLKNRLGPSIKAFDIYRDDNLTFGLDIEDMVNRMSSKEGSRLNV